MQSKSKNDWDWSKAILVPSKRKKELKKIFTIVMEHYDLRKHLDRLDRARDRHQDLPDLKEIEEAIFKCEARLIAIGLELRKYHLELG